MKRNFFKKVLFPAISLSSFSLLSFAPFTYASSITNEIYLNSLNQEIDGIPNDVPSQVISDYDQTTQDFINNSKEIPFDHNFPTPNEIQWNLGIPHIGNTWSQQFLNNYVWQVEDSSIITDGQVEFWVYELAENGSNGKTAVCVPHLWDTLEEYQADSSLAPKGTLNIPATIINPNDGLTYNVCAVQSWDFSDFAGTAYVDAFTLWFEEMYTYRTANITSLNLNNATNLEYIGHNAFYNSPIIGDIVIPMNLKYLGSGAFAKSLLNSCTILNPVNFNVNKDQGLKTNPNGAFGCRELNTYVLNPNFHVNLSFGQNAWGYAGDYSDWTLNTLYETVDDIRYFPLINSKFTYKELDVNIIGLHNYCEWTLPVNTYTDFNIAEDVFAVELQINTLPQAFTSTWQNRYPIDKYHYRDLAGDWFNLGEQDQIWYSNWANNEDVQYTFKALNAQSQTLIDQDLIKVKKGYNPSSNSGDGFNFSRANYSTGVIQPNIKVDSNIPDGIYQIQIDMSVLDYQGNKIIDSMIININRERSVEEVLINQILNNKFQISGGSLKSQEFWEKFNGQDITDKVAVKDEIKDIDGYELKKNQDYKFYCIGIDEEENLEITIELQGYYRFTGEIQSTTLEQSIIKYDYNPPLPPQPDTTVEFPVWATVLISLAGAGVLGTISWVTISKVKKSKKHIKR